MMTKSYSEMIKISGYSERLEYLKLNGVPGSIIFGSKRILGQSFYQSREWKLVRRNIIIRDNGNDLGVNGMPINGRIIIHHINPIIPESFNGDYRIFLDPDNLISVSETTHNAIHYGSNGRTEEITERRPRDQTPWDPIKVKVGEYNGSRG